MAKKRREDIGVELYGVQQQLARLQMTLEKTHDNYNVIRRIREQVYFTSYVLSVFMTTPTFSFHIGTNATF